ncbi:MAG: ABC transporter ATP-binding protein [Coriobacteriales bacterium]|jgi:iron complex transport system ATP-binding protein|nr:ABC transporter ATP-binding protein [Coriobacteriales bacterium]
MAQLSIENLSCGWAARTVLRGVYLSLSAGETLCLLGPNGSGKTTLFKTILGLMPPQAGRICVDGADTAAWGRRQRARTFAYIPQEHSPAFPFTVLELVLMGRTPHVGTLASVGRTDETIAREVLASLGIEALAERDYTQLSGGERQMVLIARALAQQPAFLVMDEPTASLDFGNQARVLSRIRTLARGGAGEPLGVIMTTHDPNQAFLLGKRVACIGRDGSFTQGDVREVLTPELLRSLYGVEVGFAELTAPDGCRVSLCTPLLEEET